MNTREKAKDARLKREFHITLDEYKRVLDYQGGTCYICKKRLNKKGLPLLLAVDHDHTTGRVRGILCWTCNKGIAVLQDDIERFRNAVKYFEAFPFDVVLGVPRFTAPGRVGTAKRKKLLAAFNAAGKGNVEKKQEKGRASRKIQKRIR